MSKVLAEMIKSSLLSQWAQLLALLAALEEVSAEFDGEDVLRPILRSDLDEATSKALQAHRQIQLWTDEFELPGVDAEECGKRESLSKLGLEPSLSALP